MNKKERFFDVDNIVEWRHIITALLALVTLAGQAQVHYRLEGNIGRLDVTDTLSVIENRGFEQNGNILSKTIDTLYIVNGNIIPMEGTLPEPVTVTAIFVTQMGNFSSPRCRITHLGSGDIWLFLFLRR